MESTDRSAAGAAKNATTTAASTGGGYGAAAGDVNSTLLPTLKQDINNPTGFTPTQTNDMLVAGEQGAGGATSGITGQAGLTAERTRNSAGLSGVYDQAARRNAQTLSQNALGVQNKSAELAQQKRASAMGGLEKMYGTDVEAQLKAMGLEPGDINAQLNAGKSGWLQNTEGVLNTLGGAAKTGAGIAGGY